MSHTQPDQALQKSEDMVSAGSASAGTVLRAQAALLSRPGSGHAATALAIELAQTFSCVRVSVGLIDQRLITIAGTSLGRDVDKQSGTAAALGAAMHESLDQRASICMPVAASRYPLITIAHAALTKVTGSAVCTVVMAGATETVGAITFERDSPPFSAEEIGTFEDIASFCGPVLEIKQQLQLAWWRRAASAFRDRYVALSPNLRMVVAGAAVITVLVLFFLPVNYRVSAPARLEGSIQRAIVAATDGFLQQANVRAGDSVKQGQVLAELATQDLQLERRRRESELKEHENAYQAAQAHNDRSQMVISQSRAGEAQAMLALVDGQLERARIQAPFDGIVIKGDLTQALGSPVQRGEILLTIAPNNSFRLIVEVDEGDIAAVLPGQTGELALAAVPERALPFTVRRVVPFASSTDSRNYFEVEAAMNEAGSNLRPGLSGIARIDVGRRSFWWIATHRLQNWLRLSFWSLGW